MDECSQERIQKAEGGQANTNAVHRKGAYEVLHNGATTKTRNCKRFHEL